MTLRQLLDTPGVEEIAHITGAAGSVGVMALHGGLESGTAELAEAVARRSGASLYAVIQPPAVAWHLPSHRYDRAESEGLRAFLDHVAAVISLHGYGRTGLVEPILAGGSNRHLAALLAVAIDRRLPATDVITDLDAIPEGLRGLHPANPVNLAAGGGVQLELPHNVRGSRPGAAARALRATPDARLVDALVDVIIDAHLLPA